MLACGTGRVGAGAVEESNCRGFRNESLVKKKKIPRDLIKFGVIEHGKDPPPSLMFNAASSHKDKFIDTNLGQMISTALTLLELLCYS